MKFSHAFAEALMQDDYPAHWVKSAISYRQLKKCIKDVQKELSSLGLKPEALQMLWKSLGTSDSSEIPLKYTFTGDKTQFKPKLMFTMSDDGDTPVDATLTPDTRSFLKELIAPNCLSALDPESSESRDSPHHFQDIETESKGTMVNQVPVITSETEPVSRASPIMIEIPLTADSTFFQLLVLDLSGLNALQSKEVDDLNGIIVGLGQGVSRVAGPSRQGEKTDLYAWREIFKLYTESDVFFSTNELNRSGNDSTKAQKHLESFLTKLGDLNVPKKLKKTDSKRLLNHFIAMNMTLLKNVKFRELNTMAMMKILKKFDKRTALGARRTFPTYFATDEFSSATLAKRVCFQISDILLAVIPQLNDYLCPVCFNISFKPIRLRCSHVFCIRCMLVMQRSNNSHCPLCREDVIMQADSTNLDPALMNMLVKYFPEEVKAKQRENERDAAIDRFGKDAAICTIM